MGTGGGDVDKDRAYEDDVLDIFEGHVSNGMFIMRGIGMVRIIVFGERIAIIKHASSALLAIAG